MHFTLEMVAKHVGSTVIGSSYYHTIIFEETKTILEEGEGFSLFHATPTSINLLYPTWKVFLHVIFRLVSYLNNIG